MFCKLIFFLSLRVWTRWIWNPPRSPRSRYPAGSTWLQPLTIRCPRPSPPTPTPTPGSPPRYRSSCPDPPLNAAWACVRRSASRLCQWTWTWPQNPLRSRNTPRTRRCPSSPDRPASPGQNQTVLRFWAGAILFCFWTAIRENMKQKSIAVPCKCIRRLFHVTSIFNGF